MIYAMLRAAEEYREDLERYRIKVSPEQHIIAYQGKAIQLHSTTRTEVVRKTIRDIINECKRLEEQKRLAKQIKLFED